MYHTDSGAKTINLFDYNRKTGAMSNMRVFAKVHSNEAGGLDGMTVDAEGYVWLASWNGWSLVRYTPQGIEEQ
jgi:sugar lactone lactonase YvrE